MKQPIDSGKSSSNPQLSVEDLFRNFETEFQVTTHRARILLINLETKERPLSEGRECDELASGLDEMCKALIALSKVDSTADRYGPIGGHARFAEGIAKAYSGLGHSNSTAYYAPDPQSIPYDLTQQLTNVERSTRKLLIESLRHFLTEAGKM